MKKHLLTLPLAFALSYSAGPSKADAITILTMDRNQNQHCSVPVLCALGGEAQLQDLAAQDLLDNGYTTEEVATILNDQQIVKAALAGQNAQVETAEEMTAFIRAVHPTVSAVYLELVTSKVSVKN